MARRYSRNQSRRRSQRRPRYPAHCLGKPAPRLARLLRRVAELKRADAEFSSLLPEDLRGHCHIAACREGRVLLHVDSSAWATRLRYLLPELRERSTLLSRAEKTEVKVRPPEAPQPVVERPPPQLSPGAAKVLLECSRHLSHPPLAESLRRLARHHKERQQSSP
jgi:hypothetical protein